MDSAVGSLTGGNTQSTSSQPYIMSGPTQAAANAAAQAQINAAQQAAMAATQNTTSAISALMGQYGTALQMAQPAINTGNQAAAQYNYMLGMPAIAPGASPTAPTLKLPTAADENITKQQIDQYITQNSKLMDTGNQGWGYMYSGAGADPTKSNMANTMPGITAGAGEQFGYLNSNGPGQGQQGDAFLQDQRLRDAAAAELAAPQLKLDTATAQQQYDQANTTYQQQLAQYNQQKGVYDAYAAKGTATGNDINNVINNLPGFQFEQKQGINAIQNAASATGMLNSGNLLQGLNEYGQGVSQKYYQNYLGNLNSLATAGNTASGQAAAGANQLGQNVAGAYTLQGNAQANAALAAGQATASSYLSPVANQQVIQTPTSSSSSSSGAGNVGGLLGGIGTLYGSGIFD